MDKIVKPGRIIFLFLLIASLITTYAVALYKLQIIEGDKYYEMSQNSRTTTRLVTAARGNILDRYGRVLVSNRNCNNLIIDTDDLFDQEDPNAIILELCQLIQASGDTYNDELPISMEPPFEYDPAMSDIDRTRLNEYLDIQKLSRDISAVDLMAAFRDKFNIDPNYDSHQTRIIAGVRYALSMHYHVKTSDYIFAEDVSMDLITHLMENDFHGFDVEVSYTREYKTDYAAHLLGYVGLMNEAEMEKYAKNPNLDYSFNAVVGKDGAEYAFEEYLHGVDGKARVTSTASGTVIGTVYTKEPVPGNHVYLTIDIGLQEVAEQVLSNFIVNKNEERQETIDEEMMLYGETETQLITGGSVVVMDVATSEPLAIASYPTFNLKTFIEDYSELLEAPNAPLFNRATHGTYAPGSTFKPVTTLCALDTGVVDLNSTFDCVGIFDKYADKGYAPACWIYGTGALHRDMNAINAIINSCNYYYYSVADILENYGGINTLAKYASDFGLGEYTGIELPEAKGNMATPEYKASLYPEGDFEGNWFTGDLLASAIGQSVSGFTPLQLASYTAALANGGTRHSASILKSVRSYDFSEKLYDRRAEILSTMQTDQEYYDAVHLGMYGVANNIEGSAYETFNNYPYCKVAAKTGTAQKGEGVANTAVFICYAPYEDPEIAIAVVIERGGGGSTTAPIAKQILDYYFSFELGNASVEAEETLLH